MWISVTCQSLHGIIGLWWKFCNLLYFSGHGFRDTLGCKFTHTPNSLNLSQGSGFGAMIWQKANTIWQHRSQDFDLKFGLIMREVLRVVDLACKYLSNTHRARLWAQHRFNNNVMTDHSCEWGEAFVLIWVTPLRWLCTWFISRLIDLVVLAISCWDLIIFQRNLSAL